VHPVGSYCKDMSRCTVNKTLNLRYIGLQAIHDVTPVFREGPFNNNNNNNNSYYLLQLGCYPVAVVILHVYKDPNKM